MKAQNARELSRIVSLAQAFGACKGSPVAFRRAENAFFVELLSPCKNSPWAVLPRDGMCHPKPIAARHGSRIVSPSFTCES